MNADLRARPSERKFACGAVRRARAPEDSKPNGEQSPYENQQMCIILLTSLGYMGEEEEYSTSFLCGGSVLSGELLHTNVVAVCGPT